LRNTTTVSIKIDSICFWCPNSIESNILRDFCRFYIFIPAYEIVSHFSSFSSGY